MDKAKLKFILLITFFTMFVILFTFTGLKEYVNPFALRDIVMRFGLLAPLIYILLYAVGTMLALPGSILTIAGGLAFGAFLGAICTIIGATLGATGSFFLARRFGRDFVERYERSQSQLVRRIDNGISTSGLQTILALRLIPVVPFNVLNYVSGLTKIHTFDYVLGTFIGIIPGTFAYSFFGANLLDLLSWRGLLALLLLAALSFLPKILRKKNKLLRG
ncbi:TVP38/TMEM64 family protein [Candidatus Woesearchaeota archaeon]|nr:MAG: TVP38/TMEM64 family protein [Candidatus Woesearchaeota archaeon]